jgi:serine/threonine protein kinase
MMNYQSSNRSFSPNIYREMISRNIPLRIVNEIGKGAYGQVYECLTNENLSVAVKRISFDKYGIRCLNEATIMSSIKHNHIAFSQNTYSDDSAIYIVSQKAKTDLNKWTRKSKKGNIPDSKTLLQWSRALVSALSCLHSQGIIHCDMKASNVLYYGKSDIRLNDFTLSIVRHNQNKKYTHNICTSTHRPYEVWSGSQWNEKVDIWGLGCTLFEIAYGQLLFPYQGGTNIPDEEIKKRMINCLLDWNNRGPVIQSNSLGQPNSNDYLTFIIPEEFLKPENNLFNSFIMSMLAVLPEDRPSIFELQKHPYLNQENTFKKISFFVYSSEGYFHGPKEKIKSRLYQFLSHEVYEFTMELFSRCHGLKHIENVILNDQLKLCLCILVACKLIKQPLPLSYFTLTDNMGGIGLSNDEYNMVFKLEPKFCEYFSFRLHVSPKIANYSSAESNTDNG